MHDSKVVGGTDLPQPFDKASHAVLQQAQAVAEAGGTVEPIHLLYALLHTAPQVWEKLPHIDAGVIKAGLPQFDAPRVASTPSKAVLGNSVQRMLAYSMEECVRAGRAPFVSAQEFVRASEYVAPEYMLLGLLREADCDAARLPRSHGISIEDARMRFNPAVNE